MLNRRHIRIKVMQALYAFKGNESEDLKVTDKFLNNSLNSMYDLYLSIVSLIIEVHKKAEDHQDKTQKKFLATKAEKNPNLKFIKNEVLMMLSANEALKAELEHRKVNPWYLDFEYVDLTFKAIMESDLYKDYMKTSVSSFKEDKNFVISIFEDVIAPNDKLYDYFEDKKLTWLDDIPVVNTSVLKLLKRLKPSASEKHFLPKLFKDEDDRGFGIDLLKKTILNQSGFSAEIANKTKNWDSERITQIDTVLMQMAICEFQKFPSIPVKVTINEYLEIAKEYSTPKSSNFINGILDKIVKEYKAENKFNKVGRGLL
ncbi:transcription antitermination factor NusB [Psychroserpens ponticola]|uniref:Transcription antitermination factor NusB n=1 Tax=Psychroserpens ponticola TaxID=2932268 RepID=A0ABY7S000_9FLAO|nr:transcription antitermination factor NusB [Psychroserpens ponticola]WCO02652.1 transcription antitermination factor NusB [Psychroserpens ponticola]